MLSAFYIFAQEEDCYSGPWSYIAYSLAAAFSKAGMAAPTAVDRRPWAFVIVTDKAKLEELEAGLPYTKMLVKAGAEIIVCGIMEKVLPGEGMEFWIQDCSAATENILLAAESMNLGAVWTAAYPSMHWEKRR